MNLTTVPIILTVGSKAKAFFSGSVNGGVRSSMPSFHPLYIFTESLQILRNQSKDMGTCGFIVYYTYKTNIFARTAAELKV